MSRKWAMAALILLAIGLGPAAAEQAAEDIEGTVTDVRVGQPSGEAGGQSYDEVIVRTNRGVDVPVRLGPAGTCRGIVQLGDQVRIRALGGGPAGGACQAQWMKVRQTGARYQFQGQAGGSAGDRDRARIRDGSCTGTGPGTGAGDRDRRRDGSGGGSGTGGGRGQGGSGGGGNGQGRGGGGGNGSGGSGRR